MPLTTTTEWPTLTAGKKAKASEVESKFDWLEGSIWPMASGTTANNTYDLGGSDKTWRAAWVNSVNPTTTADGLAIGKLTAGSSTSLDLSAMPKALLLPIVTTAQRDDLTATAGMLVYNSTDNQMQRYEGGMWLPMANYYGTRFNSVSQYTATTAVVLSTSTSGVLNRISIASSQTDTSYVTIVIDGVTIPTLTSVANTNSTYEVTHSTNDSVGAYNILGLRQFVSGAITNDIPLLNLPFKSSISVSVRRTLNGGASNARVVWGGI